MSCGFNHRHSAIFAAVRPAPHLPAFFSGRFAKGHHRDLQRLELLPVKHCDLNHIFAANKP